MNPFEMAKKAKELENIAKEAKEIWEVVTTVDANKNGIPDGVELIEHLKDLPELIKKEGSEVIEEAEDARKKIGDKMRAIVELAGEDVEAIQQAAGGKITALQAHAAKLQ